jgi:hypothetical protein
MPTSNIQKDHMNWMYKDCNSLRSENKHLFHKKKIHGGVAGDFFPKVPTEPCALGSIQPLKMSTRKLLGVKTAGA